MKQLLADPWTTATIKYPVSARLKGKVVSLTDYGAFVELEQGVEASSTSPRCPVQEGQAPLEAPHRGPGVECQVLGLTRRRTGSASASSRSRATPGSSWREVPDRLEDQRQGPHLTEFGAFVEVEEGIDGLIHISDLSWTKRINTRPRS